MDTLGNQGFAILPSVISTERANDLIAALARVNAGYGMRNLLRDVPAVRALALELTPLATLVLGPAAFPARGIFFDKIPEANWEVGWHQDLSIAVVERIDTPGFAGWSVKAGVVHVQPPSEILEQMLAVRVHLDECDEANGPLRVLPGSHGEGRLNEEAIARWKKSVEEVMCVAMKGSALLMRPLLLHASSPPAAPHHRRVIHLEYASCELPNGLRWHSRESLENGSQTCRPSQDP